MERKAAHNSTFAIAGPTCFYDSFVGKQTLVFQISIYSEKPAIANLQNVRGNNQMNYDNI
jgi:hypothetical protein